MSQNGNLAIVIKLPFPPSTNQYYRSIRMGRGVRTLVSKRGREYRDAVVGECCVSHLTNTLLAASAVQGLDYHAVTIASA